MGLVLEVYHPQLLSPGKTRNLTTLYQSISRWNPTIRLQTSQQMICPSLKSETLRLSRKLEGGYVVSSPHHTCDWMRQMEKHVAHSQRLPTIHSAHQTNSNGRALLSTGYVPELRHL